MLQQRTIQHSVRISGIGLHTGKNVTLALHPAPAGSGIRFRRVDLTQPVEIPADACLVHDTTLSTRLSINDVSISTIEHLMSALTGLGVDNVLIDVDAPEIPIVDGSAKPFVQLIQRAGLRHQGVARQFLKITAPIEVTHEDKFMRLEPAARYSVDMQIDFSHPAFKGLNNRLCMDITPQSYQRELASARTFGFLKDIEELRKHNLTLGGGIENAVVLDDEGVVNPEGLRYPDEFIRHKVLDCIGDLGLIGRPIIGHLSGYKPGHGMNNMLARAVIAHPECWYLTTQLQHDAKAQLLVA